MTKKTRTTAVAAGILLLLLAAQPTWAQEKAPFTPARFDSLQAEGALVLLDVFADWCPTCAKQKEILRAYRSEHPDVPLHILEIDFDEQKEWVTKFRAPRQSTLILYRGDEQVWFSVAETSRDVIFSALNEAASNHTEAASDR